MINILNTTCLLFEIIQFNPSVNLKYRLTNSDYEECYRSFNSTSGIMVSGSGQLKVGEFYENGAYVSYYSVLRFTFPTFNILDISIASLALNKLSGSGSTLYFSFKRGEVGFSNSDWTYFSSANLTGNSYNTSIIVPLSNAILYGENVVYIKIFATGSGSATLTGDSSPYNCPTVTINTSQPMSAATYGCAPSYTQRNDYNSTTKYNCFGYAIDINLPITLVDDYDFVSTITTDQLVEDSMLPYLIRRMKAYYDVNARLIDSYDSPIYSFERRIAFRKSLSTFGFHFMRQCSDGTWAEKNGYPSNTNHFSNGITPEDNIWGSNYDSSVYYFAVNNNGGNQNSYYF